MSFMHKAFLPVLVLASLIASGCAHRPGEPEQRDGVGFIRLDRDITLRRMVVRPAHPKGAVLLLHGFPETLYAWQAVALDLGADYEVHAFDWPGFGLSSRPAPERFGYAPSDYARVLKQYIDKAGLDRSHLTIYATDIGALPALLLALEEPDIAANIIVGDFAPFDRPQYMRENLQALKLAAGSEQARGQLNRNRDEILQNVFHREMPADARFELSPLFQDDMRGAWQHGEVTSGDAFAYYYANFTRDERYFEAHADRLKTPVKVVWGELDPYIGKAMGVEFAQRVHAPLNVLPGVGHFPHLQSPARTIAEIRASFDGS
jgi:pimeloyl-ACP methyl ester carboxylesterase